MAIKPHSIYFLSSEKNFQSACFDWAIWSIEQTKEKKSMWNLSEEMQEILRLSKVLWDDRKDWKAKAHHAQNRNRNHDNPDRNCHACAHLEPSERCIRYITTSKSGLTDLLNKLIITEITTYITDVVASSSTWSMPTPIRSVVFNLLEDHAMHKLARNQEKIKILATKIKRRESFLEHDRAPHAPSVVKEMQDLGRESNVLGNYGVTAYHCWNYISPQHFDKDHTWTISYQLFKKGCMQDEFDFSLAHWGISLETIENCAWWFKGDHLHGTVAPRQSTLGLGVHLFQGVGITVPKKTMDMAKKYLQARWSWKPLCEHWRENPEPIGNGRGKGSASHSSRNHQICGNNTSQVLDLHVFGWKVHVCM
ncbi:hypothetical protein BS17DRAFT_770121 [Gyrodon lividus]|nr:hypothetical protein BS17DRAFT_770121 [Gyrodon lividus]